MCKKLQHDILERAHVWHNQPCPDRYLKAAKPRACFFNAFILTMNKSLRYVEGFVQPCWLGYPYMVQHAWCVDVRGRVIDPTWRHDPQTVYRGVAFKSRAVATAISECNRQAEGLLTNWVWNQSPTRLAKAVSAIKPDPRLSDTSGKHT